MKRRWRILLILGACAVAGGVVLGLRPWEREPVYKGKKLSEWLRAFELGYTNETEKRIFDKEQEAAADALRHLGTNALPWLARWIEYDPPGWINGVRSVMWKLPTRGMIPRAFWSRDSMAMDALWSFRILGSNASPAVPELARWLRQHRQGSLAIRALGFMGASGFPPLLEVIEDSQNPARHAAAFSIIGLHRSGVDISSAVPTLLLLDGKTRKNTLGAPPEIDFDYYVQSLADDLGFLIPTLTNCLKHSNADVRLEAVYWLGSLGAAAVAAVPYLDLALIDPEEGVRREATNAIHKIAGEVVKRERDRIHDKPE